MEQRNADMIIYVSHAALTRQRYYGGGGEYLLQRHDAHQLPNTGDIGMTEAQQREQRVCLSNERVREGER